MRHLLGTSLGLCLLCGPAIAGPPFVTDDPVPTDYGHFENYFLSEGTFGRHDGEGALPGIEVNYGAFPDVQISGAVSEDFERDEDTSYRSHAGAAEFGIKYRFLEEDNNTWQPQVSFYPSVEVPLDRHGGEGASFLLPLWAQKSVGAWTVFGGGGYQINQGHGERNNWLAGIALLRQVTDCLQLGAEVYRQSADEPGQRGLTAFNLGALIDLSETYHIVLSSGRGLSNAQANRFSYYLAFEWTP